MPATSSSDDQAVTALIELRDATLRYHPEAVTPMEIEECRQSMIEDMGNMIDIYKSRGESIEVLERMNQQLASRPFIPSSAWILVWMAFCLGLVIGGILL